MRGNHKHCFNLVVLITKNRVQNMIVFTNKNINLFMICYSVVSVTKCPTIISREMEYLCNSIHLNHLLKAEAR